jgi:hypothetical protein
VTEPLGIRSPDLLCGRCSHPCAEHAPDGTLVGGLVAWPCELCGCDDYEQAWVQL